MKWLILLPLLLWLILSAGIVIFGLLVTFGIYWLVFTIVGAIIDGYREARAQ